MKPLLGLAAAGSAATLAALSLSAQGGVASLLPVPERIAPWTAGAEAAVYDKTTLSNFIDGAAELYLDYGFARAATREYTKGDDAITCAIFEMETPDAAFGVFSHALTPRKPRLAIGDGAWAADPQLAFWQDRYFVTLEAYPGGAHAADTLARFARDISQRIGRRAGLPRRLQQLPRRCLVEGSQKMLRGRAAADALAAIAPPGAFGLAVQDTVFAADYACADGTTRVFLLVYAHQAGPQEGLNRVKRTLGAAPGHQLVVEHERPAVWRTADHYLLVEPRGDLLAVAFGASLNDARALMREVASRALTP